MALNSLRADPATIGPCGRLAKPATPIEPLSPCLAPVATDSAEARAAAGAALSALRQPTLCAADLRPALAMLSARQASTPAPTTTTTMMTMTAGLRASNVLTSPIDALASVAAAASAGFGFGFDLDDAENGFRASGQPGGGWRAPSPPAAAEPDSEAVLISHILLSLQSGAPSDPAVGPASSPRQYPTPVESQPGKSPNRLVSRKPGPGRSGPAVKTEATTCAECGQVAFPGRAVTGLWVECSGCSGWLHCPCAGFQSDRDVRSVDKFFCRICQPSFGPTTYIRKSTRPKTAIDYAQLHEAGVPTPADPIESTNHPYVTRIKAGDFALQRNQFARFPPECATAEFIERSSFTEPIIIPAQWNPRPGSTPMHDQEREQVFEYEYSLDDGQDRIGMVIPDGLTVRQIANIHGPEEKLDVIDVRTQEVSGRWTLSQWADYFEQPGQKPIRNVISLEVSWSPLGRLIQRPQLVRDLDLQDSVWPAGEPAAKVQRYCLMSVADSFTDFHIDFGGSSVFYHVVSGRKTFFFIPPTREHLKAYEKWNLSPSQTWTWFPDTISEAAIRLDMAAGDTALIPSGWIHAVWTPEDSVVVGGNFLTRLSFPMQMAVAEVEKNTRVARKFRYPHFQRVQWYAVLAYLAADPVPELVADRLTSGHVFVRDVPSYLRPGQFGHNSAAGPAEYQARFYSRAELNGLPDLVRYIFRTVVISLANLEGVTIDGKAAVTKAIPKCDPLVTAQRFAIWAAWKRGNERIPAWAVPGWTLDDALVDIGSDRRGVKKVSEALLYSIVSTLVDLAEPTPERDLEAAVKTVVKTETPERSEPKAHSEQATTSELEMSPLKPEMVTPVKMEQACDPTEQESPMEGRRAPFGARRFACDSCRKRRVRCRHRDQTAGNGFGSAVSEPASDLVVRTIRSSGDIGSTDNCVSAGTDPDSGISLTSPLGEGRKIRNRACASCRVTKRRCVHDENGNYSPHKAPDPPVFGLFGLEQKDYHEADGPGREMEPVEPARQGVGHRVAMVYPAELVSPSTGRTGASALIRISPTKKSIGGPGDHTHGAGMHDEMGHDSRIKKPVKRRVKEVEETDEMKSERLARQLAAEEWNLRRRLRRRC